MNLSERITRAADRPLPARRSAPLAPEACRRGASILESNGALAIEHWEAEEFSCEIRNLRSASTGSGGEPAGVLAKIEL
jgi:hypothetical protein